MSAKFLPLDRLGAWLDELASVYAVHVPQKKGPAVVYRPWKSEGEGAARDASPPQPDFSARPTESAKHVLFPRSQGLFRFERDADGRVTLTEPAKPAPQLIFGLLSCDARGLLRFDPVYGGAHTQGRSPDPYYLQRRQEAVLIVRACKTALSTCFCPWVGGDPASREGADVLATQLDDGFVLEPVTDKGRSVLASKLLENASDGQMRAAQGQHDGCRAQMAKAGPSPDLTAAPEALYSLFENAGFWAGQSAGCLACGACTHLCPTCYCFNITDEEKGAAGQRLRSWDSCMFSHYTLEASGHNPRQAKAARLRNRVGHKFAYYPRLRGGAILCSGCGRCIKSCPSSIDIRKIVLDALKEAGHAR